MRERFLPKNEHHLFDHIIDIEGHPLDVGLVCERADAPYHLIRSIAIHDDPLQCIASFAQVGIFTVEKPQAGRGVDCDSAERLVHFVRDRGCQLAQSAHTSCMRELGLASP